MRGFEKGITWGRLFVIFYIVGLQNICKKFASELGSKSGVMRGFQKCITLGGRRSLDQVMDGTRGNMVWNFN